MRYTKLTIAATTSAAALVLILLITITVIVYKKKAVARTSLSNSNHKVPVTTHRIGVAIPCYKPHLSKLRRLLDSIATQTRLPDVVVVESSSTSAEDLALHAFDVVRGYAFDVYINAVPHRRNASENRNVAIGQLLDAGCTTISVFDADDVMHAQRIQFVVVAMECGAELTFHNYTEDMLTPLPMYAAADVELGTVFPKDSRTGCGCSHATGKPIHHSQVTFTRAIAQQFKYREEAQYERAEDSWFCRDVLVGDRHVVTGYIGHVLSKYEPAYAWLPV